MSRRILVGFCLLTTVLLITSWVEAQQPKKIPLIGYLSNSNRSESAARSEGIRFALRERGYIEGQNITIQYRYADGKIDRYEETIGELVRLKVDILLVGGGTTFLHAVKNATKTIPVIMMATPADPVETGLVESLARPGGNLTGISLLTSVALRNCIDLSCDQWIAGISPLKGSSFFVVYGDEVHELFNQLLPGFENPAPDHFSGQNAKPNFNLV